MNWEENVSGFEGINLVSDLRGDYEKNWGWLDQCTFIVELCGKFIKVCDSYDDCERINVNYNFTYLSLYLKLFEQWKYEVFFFVCRFKLIEIL